MRFHPFWLRLSGLLFAGFLGCALAFQWIGSSVDAKGVLHEPFALIPIGYLLIAGSATCLVVAFARRKRNR